MSEMGKAVSFEDIREHMLHFSNDRKPVSDEQLLRKSDTNALNERNLFYNDILKNYAVYVKENLVNKSKFRRQLTAVLILLLVFYILAMIYILTFRIDYKDVHISVIISTLISALTPLLILPSKIIDFNFNPHEEQYVVDIIKGLEDYDAAIRNHIKNQNH